jgi:acyl carrier protein
MQTQEQIETQVFAIISEHLGVDLDKIHMDSSLEADLGADSLDTMDLIMAFHETFHIKIKDNEIEALQTVSDIVQLILEKQED